jgi:hypothetical protein
MEAGICPDKNLVAIARDDDVTFGILHSRFHREWSLHLGTSLEDRPRYTSSTTFDTFPFPHGFSLDVPGVRYADDGKSIADAARNLDTLRNSWLRPASLVRRESEVVDGYPDRMLPKDAAAAKELQKRTLTNLYNQAPQWLLDAHRALDDAVASAYGWPKDISDEDALGALLELNLKRSLESAMQQKRGRRKSSRDVRTEPEFTLPISGGKQKGPTSADVPTRIGKNDLKPKKGSHAAPSRRRG